MARELLVGQPMLKTLACAGSILFVLCAPALAQPVAPTPAPPSASPIHLELAVTAGKTVRTHTLVLADDQCGRVQEKTRDHEDEISVCANATSRGISLTIQWMVRTGPDEYKASGGATLARGARLDFGGAQLARLAVAVK